MSNFRVGSPLPYALSPAFLRFGVFIVTAILVCGFWSHVAAADKPGADNNPATTALDGDSESSTEDNRPVQENASVAPAAPELDEQPRNSKTGELSFTIKQNDSGLLRVEIRGTGTVSGEGSISLEVDQALVERLGREIKESIREARLAGSDLADVIKSLSATLRSANEILKTLSQPETREALRQAESLLRLLPQAPAPGEGAKER